MEIQELNALLRPYNITIECGSCETVTKNPFVQRNLNQKVDLTAKKIKKGVKPRPNFLDAENRNKAAARKCRTERKPRLDENLQFIACSPINTALKTQEQLRRQSSFFMELKLSGNKFLDCPRFDNPQNGEGFKPTALYYEATAATLNNEDSGKRLALEDIGSLRKNLFDDVNFGYGAETDNCVADSLGLGMAFEKEPETGFELDFGQMQSGAEFFTFA